MPKLIVSRLSATGRVRGFTAIEIAMVATVIAIFALIVLPIFRNRVDEAKLAAARSDLTSFYKALTLAQADTSFYPRLEDLIAVEGNVPSTIPGGGFTNESPIFAYPANQNPADRRAFTEDEWRAFAVRWKGPYVTFQREILLDEMRFDPLYANFLRSRGSQPEYRPIQDLEGGAMSDSPAKRIPVDPWGNPYLFYAPDLHTDATGVETGYATGLLVSLGQDGLPGDGIGVTTNDYLRLPGSKIGTEGDLKVEF